MKRRIKKMMDWKKKLTSRKLWVAIIGFVTALCIALHVDTDSIEKIVALIMAFGELIAYIIAEGFVDGKREQS